jgi:hypothetical protein
MNIHKILKALGETQDFLAQIIRWLLGLDKPPARLRNRSVIRPVPAAASACGRPVLESG